MQAASHREQSGHEQSEQSASIILRNQKLETVHKSISKFGTGVTMLDLSGNLIKKIDIEATCGSHSPFYSMSNLKILDLSKNLIEVLHPNLFEANCRLTALNISSNQIKKDVYLRCLFKLSNLDRLDISHNCIYSLTYLALEKNIRNSLKTLKHLFFKQVGQSFGDMFPNDKNKREFLESLSGLKCWDFKRTPLESGLFQQVPPHTRLTLKENEDIQVRNKIESKLHSLPHSEQISFAVYPPDTNNYSVPKPSTEDFFKPFDDLPQEPKTPVKPIARALQVKTRIIEQMSKSQKTDKNKTEECDTAKKTANHKKSPSNIFTGSCKDSQSRLEPMLEHRSVLPKDKLTIDCENKENLFSSHRQPIANHAGSSCLHLRSPLSQKVTTQKKLMIPSDSNTTGKGLPSDSGMKAVQSKTCSHPVTVFDGIGGTNKANSDSTTDKPKPSPTPREQSLISAIEIRSKEIDACCAAHDPLIDLCGHELPAYDRPPGLSEEVQSSAVVPHGHSSSLFFEEDLSRISKHPQEASSRSQEHSANTSNKSPSNTSNKKMGMLMATGHKKDQDLDSPGFGSPTEPIPTPRETGPTVISNQLFPEPQLCHKLTCDEIDDEFIDLKDPMNNLMSSGTFFEMVDGTPDPKKPIPSSSQLGNEMSSLPAMSSQWHSSQSAATRDTHREAPAIDSGHPIDQYFHDRSFTNASN